MLRLTRDRLIGVLEYPIKHNNGYFIIFLNNPNLLSYSIGHRPYHTISQTSYWKPEFNVHHLPFPYDKFVPPYPCN